MRTTRASLYSNFDNALVQHYSRRRRRRRRQRNGTRPDDDSHRCHHRRTGPVVVIRQSVGVGWLYAFRSPQSTRNTRHAFSLLPRRRITLFLTHTRSLTQSLSLSLSHSHTHSHHSITLILTFFCCGPFLEPGRTCLSILLTKISSSYRFDCIFFHKSAIYIILIVLTYFFF